MLERDVLRQVKDYLHIKGWRVFRIHQSLGSHKGFSDLVAIRKGKTVFIEVKATGGKLSHFQERFREELQAEDIPYWVISDLDQLINILQY
jgi:Holliday junction resolvase